MNQYTDVLIGLLNASFEDDQIYFSGTHTDEQYIVQVVLYDAVHRYLVGKISREDLLNFIRNQFLKELNVPYENSIYINVFYIDDYSDKEDMHMEFVITFHVSI